jgi:hypothetical protein
MPIEPEVLLSVGIPVLGGVVWLVRQEGRINTHEEKHKQHEERAREIKEDLSYIRTKLDDMAGRVPHNK